MLLNSQLPALTVVGPGANFLLNLRPVLCPTLHATHAHVSATPRGAKPRANSPRAAQCRMAPHRITTADELRALQAQAPAATPCTCGVGRCAGWTSLTEERWPAAQMQHVGTLRDPDVAEPTYEEQHPNGTRYDSADAPVAIAFFPYNRCELWRCSVCQRLLLRYTEYGGYYVDHRVRELGPATPILD